MSRVHAAPQQTGPMRRRRDPVRELCRTMVIAITVATTGVGLAANAGAIERTLREAVEPGVHATLVWQDETGRRAFPDARPATLVGLPDFDAERKRQFVLRVAGLQPLADLADPADPLQIPFPSELPPVANAEGTQSGG